MRVCVVFRGKFEVPVRSASPCYLYSRAHSLFLYWKIFAHRSTASWPQQNVLIFAKTNCHREIVTVKLTPWDHCNMIGPFTTFEFSSENVLDGNHDVLVIRRYRDVSVFNWQNFLQRKCGSARKSQPCKKTTKNGLWRAMERIPQACEEACACDRTPLLDRLDHIVLELKVTLCTWTLEEEPEWNNHQVCYNWEYT